MGPEIWRGLAAMLIVFAVLFALAVAVGVDPGMRFPIAGSAAGMTGATIAFRRALR